MWKTSLRLSGGGRGEGAISVYRASKASDGEGFSGEAATSEEEGWASDMCGGGDKGRGENGELGSRGDWGSGVTETMQ